MLRKVPKIKDFYEFFFCINTIVSTWLDCSILMSKIRQIAPFVRGNLSKRVFAVKHTDFYPCTFSETGQRPCSYLYYANPQICRPLQDFAPREQVRNPIASTLILPVTEFVLFSASAWTWIITSYLLWPVCSFLNHKWYFAIIHKRKLS
jgi:hypothetical protein